MATHQQIDKPPSSAAARADKSKPQAGAHPAQILQRLEDAPGSIRPADVKQLQRTIGNRATGRFLQAKLKLGPAGDQYEQEADRVAKQVVSASRQPDVQREEGDEGAVQASRLADSISTLRRSQIVTPSQFFSRQTQPPTVQREAVDDEMMQAKPMTESSPRPQGFFVKRPLPPQVQREEVDDEMMQAKPLAESSPRPQGFFVKRPLPPRVQRVEMEDELQAAPNHGLEGGDVDTDVARSIQSAKGGGAPLHDGVRSSMEQGFGADFSGVRVHTGGQADALNRSLNARAFTTGNDIFFGQGQYNPGNSGGQELIAHELTHTVQQGAAGVQRVPLLRTGERVQRVLSPDSTKKQDWNNLISGSTGAGVNGVIFATNGAGEQIVVKGLAEPPQRVMLAQEMMEKVGVATTNTKPVAVAGGLGAHILQKLEDLGNALIVQQNAHGANIVTKAQTWRGFQTLLLMEPANVKNFQQLATQGPGLATPNVPLLGVRGGPQARLAQQTQLDIQQHTDYWQNLLGNRNLWYSFGRIIYVDQFLGNEDRFETLKIQNIFVDSNTGEAIAMDNDTMAADFISQITEIDAVTSPNNPQQNLRNKTPDNFISQVITGGWVYNPPLQDRMMGSLNQISGDPGELRQKTNQKTTDFLQNLQQGVANGQSANDIGANAVLTNLLNGNNADQIKVAMYRGAGHARAVINEMFQTRVKKLSFKALFERQKKQYKKDYNQKQDAMYNYLTLAIRQSYLELRAAGQDHNTALGNVQNQYRNDVAQMARTAVTYLERDQNDMTHDRLVSIN